MSALFASIMMTPTGEAVFQNDAFNQGIKGVLQQWCAYPQGRRVNALVTYEPFAPTSGLDARPFERPLTSDDLIASLKDLPQAEVPHVVVLDNAGIHTSKVIRAARPGLAKLGIFLYYLPAYSPELNRIEPVFKQVKYHEMSTRSFTTKADLRKAVEDGFETYWQRLQTNGNNEYGHVLR